MRLSLTIITLAALAAPLPPIADAQEVPNLSGTWVLQRDGSDFGGRKPPHGRVDVIDHREPQITIKRTVATSPREENVTNVVCATDGNPCTNTAGPMVMTSVLRWERRDLVMTSTTPSQRGEVITIRDRFTLSDDGNVLTQVRTVEVRGRTSTQTMVLARRP